MIDIMWRGGQRSTLADFWRPSIADGPEDGEDEVDQPEAASPSTVILYAIDLSGRLTCWNPPFEEITGLSAEQLRRAAPLATIDPEDRPRTSEAIARAYREGYAEVEARLVRADGGRMLCQWTGIPLLDAEGHPTGLAGSGRDIGGQRRAERQIRELNARLTSAYGETIAGWSRALELRDHETNGHSERVTELTVRLARAAGLRGEALGHVRRGALLHDIGKMGVPDAILRKAGPLDPDEMAIMRRHPGLALEILAPIAHLRPSLDIPYCHHERWDGTGYPRGLKGEAIPLPARIFAVVDIWDALTHDRPYRRAWPKSKALRHIRSLAGTHLDPAAVELFLREVRPSAAPPRSLPEGPRPAPVDPLRSPTRLLALRRLDLLDSPPEAPFDRLTRLAARALRAPVSLVSLVDADRQFFKSSIGLPEPWASLRETPLSHSLCQHVVIGGVPLVVRDAREDPRVACNRAIPELGVVAYLGLPLRTRQGEILGSLCVIDTTPRDWSEDDLQTMADLAAAVMTEIEQRRDLAELRAAERALEEARARLADQLRDASKLNTALACQQAELAHANVRLAEMATLDPLTGLTNRRQFADTLQSLHEQATRAGTPLSVLLADVDYFKAYNDEQGHPAGDDVLRNVAAILRREAPRCATVARYGGEEFAILLPGADARSSLQVAERIREAVEAHPWPTRPVTASFGVATLCPPCDGPWPLVERADRALYVSKRRGRNQAHHHDQTIASIATAS